MRSGSATSPGSGHAVGRRTVPHGGIRSRESRNQGVFWQTQVNAYGLAPRDPGTMRSLNDGPAAVPDFRRAQGKKHSIACALTVRALAGPANMKGCLAAAQFARPLSKEELEAVGAWKNPETGLREPVSRSTIHRIVQPAGPEALENVPFHVVREHAQQHAHRPELQPRDPESPKRSPNPRETLMCLHRRLRPDGFGAEGSADDVHLVEPGLLGDPLLAALPVHTFVGHGDAEVFLQSLFATTTSPAIIVSA